MALECKAWLPGSFSAADQFGAYTFAEVEKKILDHVGEKWAPDTRLIKGFFSDSLTPTLKAEKGMKPALLIDVDVDLYISCMQCMDWMFANGLIVPGTVVSTTTSRSSRPTRRAQGARGAHRQVEGRVAQGPRLV